MYKEVSYIIDIIMSGGCDFSWNSEIYIYRCGPLTAVLIGSSMESDGVCGGVIYNWYSDRGIGK